MNIYDNNLYCIGKWVEDELDGLAILIENSKEKMIIFKKGKEKFKITDPLKIKITKTFRPNIKNPKKRKKNVQFCK